MEIGLEIYFLIENELDYIHGFKSEQFQYIESIAYIFFYYIFFK